MCVHSSMKLPTSHFLLLLQLIFIFVPLFVSDNEDKNFLICVLFLLWCRKLLMRWTVLSSDALVFLPAVLYFLYVCYHGRNSRNSCEIAWHMMMLLINPCLILIDHGHFQVFERPPLTPSTCLCFLQWKFSEILVLLSYWFDVSFSVQLY